MKTACWSGAISVFVSSEVGDAGFTDEILECLEREFDFGERSEFTGLECFGGCDLGSVDHTIHRRLLGPHEHHVGCRSDVLVDPDLVPDREVTEREFLGLDLDDAAIVGL